MWVYMNVMRRDMREEYFVEHPAGLREITGLVLHMPTPLRSEASRIVAANGVFSACTAQTHLLEIEFDHRRQGRSHGFRPVLPLVFCF